MVVDLEKEFKKENHGYVSHDIAWNYRIIPVGINDGELQLYIDESRFGTDVGRELEILLGFPVQLTPVEGSLVEKALSKFYLRKSPMGNGGSIASHLRVKNEDFVSGLLKEARALKSSDIHLETYDQKCRIRLRIDGKLSDRMQVNKADYPALINKVKIMAGLDISEKRLPQDGRIFFNDGTEKFDIRVSVLPTLYGEKIVLRILNSNATGVELESLGFSPVDLSRFKEAIRKPNGIVLISGPTGSGKTTTLYGTLKLLNRDTDNILTVEDPIEYTLDGVNQVQVKEEIGLTFSGALRTFLRQDPDIIMVGEIRDNETANLAIRAALTGHLVLSTIHTNSAWGTIARLLDMGVPSYLLANTLNVTIAQRLIRLLCTHCKAKISVDETQFPRNFRHKEKVREVYSAVGCADCHYTGYRGRRAIYEVIPVDASVADMILCNSKDVDQYFGSQGIRTLQESAFELLKKGDTSLEETYAYFLDDQY